MKKSNGLTIINIVLGVFLAVIVLADIIIVCVAGTTVELADESYNPVIGDMEVEGLSPDFSHEADENMGDYMLSYMPILEFQGTPYVQVIGTEYEENEAMEGYQYYSVIVNVSNIGNYSQEIPYILFNCQGEQGDDIFLEYIWGEEGDYFQYANEEIIPVGQTSPVEVIVQVKDGVKEFELLMGDGIYQSLILGSEYESITVSLE